MTAIGTTYADGVDERRAAHVNSLGLALLGMGLSDDNAGKLIVPLSLGLPFTIRSGGGSPQAKTVGPSTTYTVPAGKLYYVLALNGPGAAVSYTLDPADAASWTVSFNSTNLGIAQVGLCLGAGDALTTPAGGAALGILVDASALVGSPTRVLRELNNVTSYTVGAGKLLIVTNLFANTGTTTNVVLDGSTSIQLGQVLGAPGRELTPRLLAAAGQQFAGSSANPFTLSGLEYAV